MIGKPARKAKAAARKAALVHKKAAKWGLKAHKKIGKFGVKVAKKIIKNPLKTAGAIATGGLTMGGTAGRVHRGIATGGMSEGVRFVKKLFKKKDTNVRVSGKQKRREKLDARKGAPSEKVVARRARKDAKDVEHFADKDKARTRVNKQITKRNVNQDRNDTTYQSRAEINAANPPGNSGPNRQNTAAQERTRKRLARRAARR